MTTARDPVQKEMATQKKEAKINEAELEKQAARQHNAATKISATAGHMRTGTTGNYGQPTGSHQMSAMPGHGTGQATGHVVEGVVGSHPIGTNRGPDGTATAHNSRVGGNTNASGYGTGGTYS